MLAGGFGCFIFSSKKKTSNLTNTSTDFFRKAFAGFQPANLGVIRIRRFRCRDSGEILPLRDPCMLVYLPTFSHKNQPNVRRQIYHTWILRDECKVVFFLSTEVIYGCLAFAGRLSRSKLISWSLPWKVAGPALRESMEKLGFILSCT